MLRPFFSGKRHGIGVFQHLCEGYTHYYSFSQNQQLRFGEGKSVRQGPTASMVEQDLEASSVCLPSQPFSHVAPRYCPGLCLSSSIPPP